MGFRNTDYMRRLLELMREAEDENSETRATVRRARARHGRPIMSLHQLLNLTTEAEMSSVRVQYDRFNPRPKPRH